MYDMGPFHMEKSAQLDLLRAAGLIFFLRHDDAAEEQIPRMAKADAVTLAKNSPGRQVVPFLSER